MKISLSILQSAGVAVCFMFLDDIPPLTRMYRLQRAKEIAAADDSQ